MELFSIGRNALSVYSLDLCAVLYIMLYGHKLDMMKRGKGETFFKE
jgi:hypothetical protein